jgi:hypothetical protein
MAYVILTANGDEIDRRALTGPLTIGRAQDADVPVRDILLSRKHCRIQPGAGDTWVVVDLGSKNGTFVRGHPVATHTLADGDELVIGRVRLTFRAGPFEPAPPGTRRRELVRPADPTEALAGTVAGFTLVEPGEVERQAGAPIPQPRPPEPTSYAAEDVYGMLSEIASSSWDSIMAQASRPLVMERPLPRPHAHQSAPRVVSRRRVAFCLQAPVAGGQPGSESLAAATTPAEAVATTTMTTTAPSTMTSTTNESAPAARPPIRGRWRGARHWWDMSPRAQRRVLLGLLSVVATALLVGAWVIAVYQGPQPSMATPPTYKFRAVPRTDQTDLVEITIPSSTVPALPGGAADDRLARTAATVEAPSPLDLSLPRQVTIRNAARLAALQILALP